MGISSLRLKGFKSFGRSCGFEFSRKFTAIVGPNGSGKSNILDALKWILGEGSSSGLRITKQSDLLFQGSKSISQSDNAEVILSLTSGDDKCTLRRIYSRDSGSLMFLDGKKILIQDIDSVKSKFNLTGEGFALIGQGEISATIHQRPSERRRQLDSLFKIERYRERVNESMKQLTESQNELLRIRTLIDELNSRRAEISDEVNLAVQAQGIIDELDSLRHDYYFFKRYANEKEQADLELRRHIEESKLDELNEWLHIWTLGLKHYESILVPSEAQSSFMTQLESINSRKDSIHRRAFQVSTQLRDILSKRKSLSESLISLRSRKESLEHERELRRKDYEAVTHEAELKQHELSEREHELKEAQKEAHDKIQERKKIVDDIAKIKLRRSRIESEINVSESSRESRLAAIHELEEEKESKQRVVSGLKSQKDSLEEKFAHLSFSYEQANSNVQSLRRNISLLESQHESLENSKIFTVSYPEPVRAILKASRDNIIKSDPKAVADVFSCSSSEAANAIEAFLGARQYWLLVHTLEEAYEGIEYLKANRSGRVTYLPDESCRPRTHDGSINVSGRVMGWAVNLISIQPEWRDAVLHLMGDLLIVEDYGTAVALVRKGAKFPIATVEGEVLNPSGSVSGGSSRNIMGAVTAMQKQDDISRQLDTLMKSIADSQRKLEDETELSTRLRREFEDVSNTLERVKYDLNYEQRNLNIITGNLERMTLEHEHSESQTESLKTELNESIHTLESLELELNEIGDINESTDILIAPLRNELHMLNERINLTRKLYEHVESEYASVCSGIENAEREIDSGMVIENDSRKILRELSCDKKQAYHEELNIRRELLRNNQEWASARRKLERIRMKLGHVNERISSHRNSISETENKISHIENERSQLIELWDFKYPYDKKEAMKVEGGRELTSSLRKLERELKSLGTYNLGALSEDESLAERIDFLTVQIEDVNTGIDELRTYIEDTNAQVEEEFTYDLSRVDEKFNALFQRLFGGGEARLRLQEGESIWDRGVEIFARPPGKKLQNISQLSGGEQSLTSIALIFATLEEAHTPLAVLDEVDAALDEYNLIRFAELAREYSDSIQIIAMTHRRATMEHADLIYGVTMIEPGLTATIGIDPKNYA